MAFELGSASCSFYYPYFPVFVFKIKVYTCKKRVLNLQIRLHSKKCFIQSNAKSSPKDLFHYQTDWQTDRPTKYQILLSMFQQTACLHSTNFVLNGMRINSFVCGHLHVLLSKNWHAIHVKNCDANVCKRTNANELILIAFNTKLMECKLAIC